jgi:uncharacterized protein (TIGR04141 family)
MPMFTVYLVKPDYQNAERYVEAGSAVTENYKSIFNDGVTTSTSFYISTYIASKEIEVKKISRSASPFEVYYRETNNQNPWWKGYWRMPEQLENQSVDVLVTLGIDGRLFLITHGHARFLINPLAIEYDFGLKTALNIIDEDKIKSADLFTPSEIALRTRKQVGKKTKIEEYDINIFNSLLKDVAGSVVPEFEEYFKNIDGADSIKFSFSEEASELVEILKRLYSKYELTTYRQKGFDWIDNFRVIKDKSLIAILDAKLIDAVNAKSEEILLSIIEIEDNVIPVYYRFVNISRRFSKDLNPTAEITKYYEILIAANLTVTLEDIKRHQILTRDMNSNKDLLPQKIYQCLYYEVTHDGKQYFIESGSWYLVDNTFSRTINDRLDDVMASSRNIPFTYNNAQISLEARDRRVNKEYVFNEKLTAFLATTNLACLLDTNLVIYQRSKIEVCDILYSEGDSIILLHNKYKYGSSALSHLFNQGYVSAKLLTDPDFRQKANAKIEDELLHFPIDELDRSTNKVVFGIISRRNRQGKFSIPLFGKISFDMICRSIDLIDFHYEIVFFEAI